MTINSINYLPNIPDVAIGSPKDTITINLLVSNPVRCYSAGIYLVQMKTLMRKCG